MKFLDLFAGIGGFRLGMESAGHTCVGFVEWDKFARASYEAIHNTEGEWTRHDITTVTDAEWRELRGKVDIICGGFPCQAFSVAGKRQGFNDTRGTMFFEIARAAKEIKPRFLLLENVKGLLSHDKGNTFGTILNTLDELGYDAEWQVLNSKDFGVPQNRERVFIVGHLRGASGREVFPIRGYAKASDIKVIGTTKSPTQTALGERYNVYGLDGSMGCLTATDYKQPKQILVKGNLDIKGQDAIKRVYDTEGISPTLTTMQGGQREPKIAIPVLTPDRAEKRQNGRRFKEDGEPMFTLTAQDRHGVAIREATKKGFDIATEGDSINLAIPGSQTRRGRVGKGVANTLDTSCNQGVLVPKSRTQELLENLPNDKKVAWAIGHHPFSKKFEFDGYHGDVSPCLVATDYKAPKTTLTADLRIRKLTPRECWRLQGFPDELFDKAKEVNSDSQLYKQAGNSVTVNVITAIAANLEGNK